MSWSQWFSGSDWVVDGKGGLTASDLETWGSVGGNPFICALGNACWMLCTNQRNSRTKSRLLRSGFVLGSSQESATYHFSCDMRRSICEVSCRLSQWDLLTSGADAMKLQGVLIFLHQSQSKVPVISQRRGSIVEILLPPRI